ncbi:MAG: hypothetical protein IJP30_00010 [Clostridia bacterium]|nr:hypothetical protein [Clostridia bacterium]
MKGYADLDDLLANDADARCMVTMMDSKTLQGLSARARRIHSFSDLYHETMKLLR